MEIVQAQNVKPLFPKHGAMGFKFSPIHLQALPCLFSEGA